MQAKIIKISDLHLNTGQIKDVPKNPRFIKDERYEALKKALRMTQKCFNYAKLLHTIITENLS